MVHWYALYTKPRKEQKVAQQLDQLGFTVYLPLKTELRQWSDRKKKVISPLFTSYVFIQIEESKRDTVFVIDGILNYVFWLGKPAVIRDEDMEVEFISNQKAHLFLPSLGMKLVISRMAL